MCCDHGLFGMHNGNDITLQPLNAMLLSNPAAERLHMVRRWSARAAVDWRIASRMLDLHKRVGETPVLQASGNAYPQVPGPPYLVSAGALASIRLMFAGECRGGCAARALRCVCIADAAQHSCQLHQLCAVLQLQACPAPGMAQVVQPKSP